MATLFELSNDMRDLLEFGCDPEEQETFLQTLEPYITAINEKADDYCTVLSHFEGQAAMIEKEVEALNRRKKAIEASVKKMKEMLLYSMVTTCRKEINTDLHSIKVRGNGGKQPLDITGEVPKEYEKTVITVEPDRDKIREALEKGVKLDFATLKERGKHLDIK